MIQVSKTEDLLNAIPIVMQLKNHDRKEIVFKVFEAMRKTCLALGLNPLDEQLELMANDTIDLYTHDSIEDIIECMKKGRSGVYGYGHNNRNNFNMLVVKDWMALHLEKKYEAREKELSKTKSEEIKIDYEAYAKEQKKKLIQHGKKLVSSLNILTSAEREKRAKELVKKLEL